MVSVKESGQAKAENQAPSAEISHQPTRYLDQLAAKLWTRKRPQQLNVTKMH